MPVQQTRRIFDIEGLKGLTCFDIVHSEVCKGLWTVRNNNNKGCVVERKKALSDKVGGTSGSHDVVEVRAVSYSVNRTHPVYRLLAASYGKGKETRPRRKKQRLLMDNAADDDEAEEEEEEGASSEQDC